MVVFKWETCGISLRLQETRIGKGQDGDRPTCKLAKTLEALGMRGLRIFLVIAVLAVSADADEPWRPETAKALGKALAMMGDEGEEGWAPMGAAVMPARAEAGRFSQTDLSPSSSLRDLGMTMALSGGGLEPVVSSRGGYDRLIKVSEFRMGDSRYAAWTWAKNNTIFVRVDGPRGVLYSNSYQLGDINKYNRITSDLNIKAQQYASLSTDISRMGQSYSTAWGQDILTGAQYI